MPRCALRNLLSLPSRASACKLRTTEFYKDGRTAPRPPGLIRPPSPPGVLSPTLHQGREVRAPPVVLRAVYFCPARWTAAPGHASSCRSCFFRYNRRLAFPPAPPCASIAGGHYRYSIYASLSFAALRTSESPLSALPGVRLPAANDGKGSCAPKCETSPNAASSPMSGERSKQKPHPQHEEPRPAKNRRSRILAERRAARRSRKERGIVSPPPEPKTHPRSQSHPRSHCHPRSQRHPRSHCHPQSHCHSQSDCHTRSQRHPRSQRHSRSKDIRPPRPPSGGFSDHTTHGIAPPAPVRGSARPVRHKGRYSTAPSRLVESLFGKEGLSLSIRPRHGWRAAPQPPRTNEAPPFRWSFDPNASRASTAKRRATGGVL